MATNFHGILHSGRGARELEKIFVQRSGQASHDLLYCINAIMTILILQIPTVTICSQSVLDLARHSLAQMGSSECSTWLHHIAERSMFTGLEITLSGLCLVVINFLTLLYYDPTYLADKGGASGPPQWVYFTCVLYRILRRTGMIYLLQVGHRAFPLSKP